MKKEIHTAKSSHNENFGQMLEELVQNKVTELLSVYFEIEKSVCDISQNEDPLTVKQVAVLLGMNERIVREKISQGLIPAYKPDFSNKYYILKSELIDEIKRGFQYKSIGMITDEINARDISAHVKLKKAVA